MSRVQTFAARPVTRRECLAALSGAALVGLPDAPAFEPTSAFRTLAIRGWRLRVNRALLSMPALWEPVRDLMEQQLFQITRVVPQPALEKLQQVAIWVEAKEPHHPCMCYHPDAAWLREHSMNPEKARCVEVANARSFLAWTLQQPWMALHELAHAYHHQQLTFEHAGVRAAYESAVKSGRYESVLHWDGKMVRHYALTNPMEYFAELTESYFGANDFYPFVRSELKMHDPAGYALMEELWGVKPAGA